MKKIFHSLSLLMTVALLSLSSCNDQTYAPAEYEYVGFRSSTIPKTVAEGTGAASSTASFSVNYGNNATAPRDITVTIEIAATSTAAVTSDFTLEGVTLSGNKFTVVIPAGSVSAPFKLHTVTNGTKQPSKTVVLNVVDGGTGVSVGGYPYPNTHTLTIQDDDCDLNIVGTMKCNEPGYGTYDVTISQNGAANAFLISNWWDSGLDIPFTVDLNGSALTVTTTSFVIGGKSYTVTGSGTYSSCASTMTYHYIVKRDSDGALIDDNTHTYTKP